MPEQVTALLVAVMGGIQLQWLHDPEAVDMSDLMGVLTDVLRGGEPRPDAG